MSMSVTAKKPQLSSPHLRMIIGLCLVTVVALPYWQVGSFDFVDIDDGIYVEDNPNTRAG